jgi:hypothetical protein
VFDLSGRIQRGWPRALVVGAACLVLALAVLCGSLQAGTRYFYCEAMGLSTSDPCAGPARSDRDCPFEAIDRALVDCCMIITLPSMPQAASTDEPSVPPAGVLAILPAREYARSPVRSLATGFARWVQRWERPPRPGGDLRLQSMVFLT